ncbi:YkgJ family cysteine cluster protein [Desulfovibrio sp. OttesenSCG-928-A18]|nr:YkgJ family cysteine cluster protein [Desulfovibrio sp. OttesenSCG-928-A18]
MKYTPEKEERKIKDAAARPVSTGQGQSAFDCRMCGHCCEGRGGIVVDDADLARLCAHLALDAAEFERRWAERRGGKLQLRSLERGGCVFFVPGEGCSVHEAKPDICRAWPYFRGNLIDSESFALAKDFCPGISPVQEHADFVREGIAYLQKQGLTGHMGKDRANALRIKDLLPDPEK